MIKEWNIQIVNLKQGIEKQDREKDGRRKEERKRKTKKERMNMLMLIRYMQDARV